MRFDFPRWLLIVGGTRGRHGCPHPVQEAKSQKGIITRTRSVVKSCEQWRAHRRSYRTTASPAPRRDQNLKNQRGQQYPQPFASGYFIQLMTSLMFIPLRLITPIYGDSPGLVATIAKNGINSFIFRFFFSSAIKINQLRFLTDENLGIPRNS